MHTAYKLVMPLLADIVIKSYAQGILAWHGDVDVSSPVSQAVW